MCRCLGHKQQPEVYRAQQRKRKAAWEIYLTQTESEEGCGRWKKEDQRTLWEMFGLWEERDVQGMAESGACHTWLQLSWVFVAGKPLSRFVQGTEALVKLSFSLGPEERAQVLGASYTLLLVPHHEPRQGEETPRRTV